MRYFIYISYDGARFHGWQIQPNGLSVQEVLQDSLSTVLRTRIEVVGAGRTDAGVNASEMVAHFDYMDELSPLDLTRKLNRILPKDVTVDHLAQVKNDAHARFDAISRTYKYYISTKRHPFLRHYAYYYPQTLDYHLMNEAAKRLFYYTDFTSFSKLHTDVKTNNCKIMQAKWRKIDNLPYIASDLSSCDLWEFTIQADRFLRNMVRAIVGTLIDVGRGRLSLLDFCRIIELKDRCAAGVSVPGHALFLHQVSYPDELFILQK